MGEAIANSMSVAAPGAVEAVAAMVLDRWGQIDILVINAGILRDRSFSKLDIDDWIAMIDVHLNGAARMCRAIYERFSPDLVAAAAHYLVS